MIANDKEDTQCVWGRARFRIARMINNGQHSRCTISVIWIVRNSGTPTCPEWMMTSSSVGKMEKTDLVVVSFYTCNVGLFFKLRDVVKGEDTRSSFDGSSEGPPVVQKRRSVHDNNCVYHPPLEVLYTSDASLILPSQFRMQYPRMGVILALQ